MSAETVGLVPADVKAAESGKTLIARVVGHLHMIPAAYVYQTRHQLPTLPDINPEYFIGTPQIPIDGIEAIPRPEHHPNDWASYPNPALGKNIV